MVERNPAYTRRLRRIGSLSPAVGFARKLLRNNVLNSGGRASRRAAAGASPSQDAAVSGIRRSPDLGFRRTPRELQSTRKKTTRRRTFLSQNRAVASRPRSAARGQETANCGAPASVIMHSATLQILCVTAAIVFPAIVQGQDTPPIADELVAQLGDPSFEVRRTAADQLRLLGERRHIPTTKSASDLLGFWTTSWDGAT